MADNGKMFRTSISGYNKDDVNRYILEIDKKSKETAETMSSEIKALTAETESLSLSLRKTVEENAELSAKLTELQEELDNLQAKLQAKSAENEEISKEYKACKTLLKEKNTALSAASVENTSLKQRLDSLTANVSAKDTQLKAAAEKYAADLETLRTAYETELTAAREAAKPDESAAYKLNMYEKISSQIGDILINANRSSDEIISSARAEAEKLLTQTNDEASERSRRMRTGIHGCVSEAVTELKEEFLSSMTNCTGELQTCMKEIQYETDALMAFLTRKQEEMTERIEFYYGTVSESIDEKLNNMDSRCSGIIHSENTEQ